MDVESYWHPEESAEYAKFKEITKENASLANAIRANITLDQGDLVLDVGGREGSVSFAIQEKEFVHIVDPGNSIRLLKEPQKFWSERVQDVYFPPGLEYRLIICCHVLGYLYAQDALPEVLEKLSGILEMKGSLVLFYNTNSGYMGELHDYARHVLPMRHHDQFNADELLKPYRTPRYEIRYLDLSFDAVYETHYELARACWFLFGGMDPNIEECARRFLPKLENDLIQPQFPIEQRAMFIKRVRR